jgi:hypothetical protein
MAIEAAIVQYRQEFVAAFEQRTSMLKMATTKESVIKGNQATFLVSGSGGATAVTRGTNGLIPYGNPSNTQVTATLVEKHATNELTNFNIFASQGDQRRIMQMASMATINRDIDLTILAELANATQDYGTGAASVSTAIGAKVILGNNQVDTTQTEKMWAVVSPAFMGYLMQTPEFSNSQYVDMKPFAGPARKVLRWAGVNWIESPLVTGVGTSSEILYMFHQDAIGYAVDIKEEFVDADYERKQDSSWTKATVYHGAKILQNTGIVKITHDGSAFVAT